MGTEHEPGEDLTIHWVDLSEACEKALRGEIREEISALALLRIRRDLVRLRANPLPEPE